MIWHALLYATARSTPELRRLGLVGDALALRSRALRQRRSWKPHEERCHAFVKRVVDGCAQHRTAVVLGSGLILDVPLERLADRFERLVLVDAVHLLPARLRARRAGAQTLVADLAHERAPLLASLQADPSVDLVISANLLSQMPLPHRRRADDWDSPEPLTTFGRQHLADLDAFKAPICLLTDVAYRDRNPYGSHSDETPLADETLLPPPNESWDWEVAPFGEIDRSFARIHRVCAWHLPPGNATGGAGRARSPA